MAVKYWFGYGDLSGAINVAIILLVFIFSILLSESAIRKKYRFISSTHSAKKAPKIKLYGKQNFLAFFISFLISLITLFIPCFVLLMLLTKLHFILINGFQAQEIHFQTALLSVVKYRP